MRIGSLLSYTDEKYRIGQAAFDVEGSCPRTVESSSSSTSLKLSRPMGQDKFKMLRKDRAEKNIPLNAIVNMAD